MTNKTTIFIFSNLVMALFLGSVSGKTLSPTEQSVVTSVRAEGGNIKEAREQAYKNIVDKILDNHLLYEQSHYGKIRFHLDKEQKLVLPETLTMQNLGRSSNGEVHRVMLFLTVQNYKSILRTLMLEASELIENSSWNSEGIEDLRSKISSLKILTDMDVKGLSSLQIDYQEKSKQLEQEFDRILEKATLTFSGEIEEAQILIDGEEKLVKTNILLLPGKHHFEVKKEGYLTLAGFFYLTQGESRNVFISLIPHPQKQINVKLFLDKKLRPHEDYIKKILKVLGLTTDEDSEILFDINLKQTQSTLVQEDFTITDFSIVLEISEPEQRISLMNKSWRQNFVSSAKGEVNEIELSLFVKDSIQRSLYYFANQIDREYIFENLD